MRRQDGTRKETRQDRLPALLCPVRDGKKEKDVLEV